MGYVSTFTTYIKHKNIKRQIDKYMDVDLGLTINNYMYMCNTGH